jgi:hypothetical protein
MLQDEDAQIPSTRSPGGINFLQWRLIFVWVLSVELFHINYRRLDFLDLSTRAV